MFNVSESAGQDLFAVPSSFWAALPEPEAAICPAAHLQPRARPQRESLCTLLLSSNEDLHCSLHYEKDDDWLLIGH